MIILHLMASTIKKPKVAIQGHLEFERAKQGEDDESFYTGMNIMKHKITLTPNINNRPTILVISKQGHIM
jgi:hypothetical protein